MTDERALRATLYARWAKAQAAGSTQSSGRARGRPLPRNDHRPRSGASPRGLLPRPTQGHDRCGRDSRRAPKRQPRGPPRPLHTAAHDPHRVNAGRRHALREHGPELLADHGLHERASLQASRARRLPSCIGVRPKHLLAGAAGVKGAVLGRERLQRVVRRPGGRFLTPPKTGRRSDLRGARRGLALERRNTRGDGFSRFYGLRGANSATVELPGGAPDSAPGRPRSRGKPAWKPRRPG